MKKFLMVCLCGIVLGATMQAQHMLDGAPPAASIFQVVRTPNPLPNNDLLAGVGASSASDIWAVGDTTIHYNGTKWSGFAVPKISGGTFGNFNAVASLSSTNAWAVGTYTNTNGLIQGLIAQWNGTVWTQVPGPFAAGSEPILFGITAISSSDIWAVGGIISGSSIQPLFLHYDGSTWVQEPSPLIGGFGPSYIQSVSAVATNDVYAVGWSGPENNDSRTLIEHWNGSTWAVMASPSVGAGANQLNGVVAISSNNVWATGFSVSVAPPAEAPQQTLIEHWDGASWSVVASPNTGSGQFQSNRLFGVTAVSATDIYAFGSAFFADGSGQQSTLMEHWNGTTWKIIPSPNPKASNFLSNILTGGVVTGPGSVWVVGSQDEAPMPFTGTLVLHTTKG